MTIYVALLRGINVGGHKIIKMDKLSSIFDSLQFNNVRTYIQSGNVIFETNDQDPVMICEKIEAAIKAGTGFEIPVIIRSIEELEKVIKQNPFAETAISENESLYVTFLSQEPTAAALHKLESFRNESEDFRVLNRDVYILFRKSIRESLFTNNFLEKKLGVSATTRNWETVNALVNMCRD
jgi:uncharacterized protein (DUF1697 family)